MSLFAIGDLHLSFSCDKPMNIFKGWADYEERIKSNWNSVVSENDTVVIPGDISWAMSLDEAEEDFRFIHNLNGEKIIIKGNHDYWWNTLSKMNAFLNDNGFSTIKILHNNAYLCGNTAVAGTRGWFFEEGSEADEKVIMREVGRLKASVSAAEKLSDNIAVFLHYPPISETQKCEPFLEVIKNHNIKKCYFGHLHGFVTPGNMKITFEGTDFSLVSADKLDFCPKLVSKD